MVFLISPDHDLAIPIEAEPIIQQETRGHPDVDTDDDD